MSAKLPGKQSEKPLESLGIDVVYPLHNTTHTRSIAYRFFIVNRVLAFLAIGEKMEKIFRAFFRKINRKFTIFNALFACDNTNLSILNER